MGNLCAIFRTRSRHTTLSWPPQRLEDIVLITPEYQFLAHTASTTHTVRFRVRLCFRLLCDLLWIFFPFDFVSLFRAGYFSFEGMLGFESETVYVAETPTRNKIHEWQIKEIFGA